MTGLRLKRRMCHRRWHEFIRAGQRGRTGSGRAVRGRAACLRFQQRRTASGRLARRTGAGSSRLRSTRWLDQSVRPGHPARHRGILALSVRSGPRRRRAADPPAGVRPGVASRRADRENHARRVRRRRRDRRDASASPHEGGGRADDRAVRHRRGLAGDAGDGGADRSCGGLGAGGACASCCARRSRAAG